VNFFWEVTTPINNWIVAHKELVTLIVLPLVTWIITSILSNAAEKRTKEANASAAKLAEVSRLAAEERANESRRDAEDRSAKERRLQLELARRMKLSEFRQNWINELREDFSVILSFDSAGLKSADPRVTDVNKSIQSVLLRMNPGEELPKDIFAMLQKMIKENDKEKKEELSFDLTNLVNSFLKSEWVRLKQELIEYQELEA
jgi:hypothetical protein